MKVEGKQFKSMTAPIAVNFEITPVCNWRCKFCYEHKNTTHPRKEYLFNIIDKIAEANVFSINLFGGEPTTHPDITEIIDYCYDKGLYITMISNGQALTKEIIQAMVRVEGGMGISLHGSTPEIHDKISQVPGSWEKTMQSIKNIDEAGLEVVLNFTAVKENYLDIEEYTKLFRDMKHVNEIVINRFMMTGAAHELHQFHLAPKEMLDLAWAMHRAGKNNNKSVIFSDTVPLCALPKELHYLSEACGAGTRFAGIALNGDVKLCSLSSVVFGNILETPLKEIWNNDKINKFRELSWAPKKCTNCSILEQCGMGCKTSNPATNNFTYGPDIYMKE